MGTVTLAVKHGKKDDDGILVETINIGQTISGGIPGTAENRILNWKERDNEDHLFGAVKGRSRRVKLDDLENDWLKNGWLPDTIENGAIQSYVQSNTEKSGTDWIVEQVNKAPFK